MMIKVLHFVQLGDLPWIPQDDECLFEADAWRVGKRGELELLVYPPDAAMVDPEVVMTFSSDNWAWVRVEGECCPAVENAKAELATT